MIQIGIIGFGKMGKTRARAIAESGKGVVVKAYEVYPPEKHDSISFVSSEEEILKDPKIEAVFICTPNYRNHPLTIAALENGKHVFCEKPPAFTAQQVEEIQKVEQKSGCRLMYGFNLRHHASIQHIKSLIASGSYGHVLWMRGRYGKSVDANFFNSWRANRKMAGGGIMLDQGIHMLDLFMHFAGDFDEVRAFVSNLFWKIDIEDNVFAMFRNSKTGVAASLHSTMTQWRHLFSLEIFLEKGYMVLNGLKTSSNSYGKEELSIAKNRTAAPSATWQDEEKIVYETDNSWIAEVTYFLQCLESKSPIQIGNSSEALRLMRIIDKIYKDS
jgi:1,5-anhydro-D-fructose reductase (1,5-anhydro-D-mannitol-forming)